jgi:hypothetical protein
MKKKHFYLTIGLVLSIFSLIFVNTFPMNLPFALVGGALVGWNLK